MLNEAYCDNAEDMSQQLILPCRKRPPSRTCSDLPPELLEQVIDHLDRKSIIAALYTSKRWKDVATPMMLRVDRRQGRLLAQQIADNVSVGSLVRHLAIDYSFDKTYWCADADAATILRATPNLRSFSIRGYWPGAEDDHWEKHDSEEDGPWEGYDGELQPPWTDWPAGQSRLLSLLESSEHLSSLESCMFHYRNTSDEPIHWGLETHVGVFLGANIKALDFIHAYHIAPHELIFPCNDQHHASTALQSLRFKDCDIDIAAFKKILCFPKALRHLTYTERQCWARGWNLPELKDATAFAEAFVLQSKSLETIHLQGLYHGELGARFGGMKALKHLDIELGILFGCGNVPTDNNKCYALNKIPIDELLPPTLESLTLRYSVSAMLPEEQLRVIALRRLLAGKQRFLPRFRKLILLREQKEILLDKHQGVLKCDRKVDGVYTSVKDVCRAFNVELVDGGFYEDHTSRWGHSSPP